MSSLPTWGKPPMLLPRRVGFFCSNWSPSAKWSPPWCEHRASVWLCSDETFVARVCDACAAKSLPQLQTVGVWYLEPIYHNKPESIAIPRDMGERA